MSKFYDACDAIKTRLDAVALLSGIPIVVDRQRDIASALISAIGKQSGSLIVIAWAGAGNEDVSCDGPRFSSRFAVSVIAKPVLRKDATPADDLVESIAANLHDARLVAGNPHRDRLVVTGIEPVIHDELLIHRIDIKTNSQF